MLWGEPSLVAREEELAIKWAQHISSISQLISSWAILFFTKQMDITSGLGIRGFKKKLATLYIQLKFSCYREWTLRSEGQSEFLEEISDLIILCLYFVFGKIFYLFICNDKSHWHFIICIYKFYSKSLSLGRIKSCPVANLCQRCLERNEKLN